MNKNFSDKSLNEVLKRYYEIVSFDNLSMNETVYRFYNEADGDNEEPQQDGQSDPNMGTQGAEDPNMGMTPPVTNDPNSVNPMGTDPNMSPNPATPPNNPDSQTDDMGDNMSDMGDMSGDTTPQDGGDAEIDVTELVNTTNSIAHRIEKTAGSLQRIYDKINDVESKLGNMGAIITQLSRLEKQVELMRPPTENERRKALADKSYPYSVSDKDYLEGNGYKTQTDMEKKPDRMSMMDTLMSDYDSNDVKKSFYPAYNDDKMNNLR